MKQYTSVSLPLKRIKVTSPFGMRKDPFTGKRRMHNVIDLHARNDEVYAMFPGVVKKVGYDKRSGNYVTLQHGDYTVSYCHLSKVNWIKVHAYTRMMLWVSLEIQVVVLENTCISPAKEMANTLILKSCSNT